MYDSRARERRRQIEEQEALAARLLRQVTLHLLWSTLPLPGFYIPVFNMLLLWQPALV